MAESRYLKSLTQSEKDKLKVLLFNQNKGKCFICEKDMDLRSQNLDIDHKFAVSLGGQDNESNFALTHAGCNRSKGTRDLQLQKYIESFRNFVKDKTSQMQPGQSVTVGDVLSDKGGSKADIAISYDDEMVKIFYEANRKPESFKCQLVVDKQNSNIKSFIGMLPKEIVFHDPDINPRSIVDLEPMIEEFYQKRPQLQPSLGFIVLDNHNKGRIKLFDGQHKAAAQLINGADHLFIRVFVNPDIDLINKTNFRAHTKLAQTHFPQLIADKVAHSIFEDEFLSYFSNADIKKDSESKFIDSLSAELKSEYRGYLKSYYKFDTLSSTNLEIMKYVETVSSRSKTYPLSFESLRRGLLEIFLFLKASSEPLEISQKMRELESQNMQKILDILVEEVFKGKFQVNVGIFKIEERLQNNDPKITIDHLIAYRMHRQPALIAWAEEFRTALNTYFNSRNKYQKDWSKEKYLWVKIDDDDIIMIRKMIKYIKTHPAWCVKEENIVKMISTNSVGDWRQIILEGKLPGTTKPIYEPMNGGQILIKSAAMK